MRYHLLLFRARPGERQDVDEDPLAGEAPAAYVERVARAKADAGWRRMLQRNLPQAPVLAADTTVALDGRIFGKPASRDEAAEMLAALSGTRHEVLTAVALKHRRLAGERAVRFRGRVQEARRRRRSAQYVATGECDDKAGAYAIQGRAARFIVELRGSYSGVMGLPLYETGQLIDQLPQRR